MNTAYDGCVEEKGEGKGEGEGKGGGIGIIPSFLLRVWREGLGGWLWRCWFEYFLTWFLNCVARLISALLQHKDY